MSGKRTQKRRTFRNIVMAAALTLASATAAAAATPPPTGSPTATAPQATTASPTAASPTTAATTAAPKTTTAAPAVTAPSKLTGVALKAKPSPKPSPSSTATQTPTPTPTPSPTPTPTPTPTPSPTPTPTPTLPAAPTCQPLTAPPTNNFPGSTVVADNLESGSLANWSVQTNGSGTASVVGSPVFTGGCAGYLHTTSTKGSLANASVAIPAGTAEVYADGYFDLATAGTGTGASNPFFRFFNGSTRIATVYRYASNGQLWLETLSPTAGWVRTRLTTQALSLSAWHHVEAALLPNGTATTVEVWLDDSLVYSSTGVNGPTVPVTSVMMGSESTNQQGDLYFDNVLIKAATAVQNNCDAAVPSNTMPGQTVVTDGFECGNLSKWTVHMGGDGTASTQTGTVFDGTTAASLVTSYNSGSLANISHELPAGSVQSDVDGWFNITAEGPTGNDVPYFRFFTGATRFADIYRYNVTGQMWLRVLTPAGTFSYVRLTSYAIPLDTWQHVQMEVIPNGAATSISIWLNDALLYSSTAVSTSATNATTVMLGSEHAPQPASINIDDVIVKAE